MSASRTLTSPLAAVAVLGLLASGCTGGGDDRPEVPRSLLTSLSTALSDHTLSGVPLVDPAAEELFTTQVADLKNRPVTVTAGTPNLTDAGATVPLDWEWDLHGSTWSYATTVSMVSTSASSWKVDWKPGALAPELSDTEVLDLTRTQPVRAEILGADGAVIVTERQVSRYGLNKAELGTASVEDSARRIATLLGIDAPAYVKRALAAGPKQFVEALVVRNNQLFTLKDGFADIPGAQVLSDTMPLAPTAEFAAELLGRVGPATAEIVEKSQGRLQPDDEVGISGLQARYDEQLAGTPTIRVSAVSSAPPTPGASPSASPSASDDLTPAGPASDATTRASAQPVPEGTRVLKTWPGTEPRPVSLTLDVATQKAAEKALAGLPARRGASALVALRPSTGEILAAANGPHNNGTNAATYGRYAPGSTFKVVSSLALLRHGLTPQDWLACPATTTVNGKRFKNYDDYPASGLGKITFAQALANSCNTAFINARTRLGAEDLATAAADLGLGVDHDLGFPAYFGQVPTAEGETEKAADMIGQGKVLSSPLVMATVAASVQAGRTVVPHLMESPQVSSQPSGKLSAGEAAQLRKLMQGVVATGSGRFLGEFGQGTGAKTGTAEFGTPQADGTLLTHTWMIAFSGDLAVAVMVEKGDTGSGTSGPVLTEFLRAVKKQ